MTPEDFRIKRFDVAGWIFRQLPVHLETADGVVMGPTAQSFGELLIRRLADPNCEGSEEVIAAILTTRALIERANDSGEHDP